ncbi:MAG: hypothetical protein IJS22_04070 [Lachnospiraceae bacterium]|nr:hypothetical protein [Lachnospiraceae bacterium]
MNSKTNDKAYLPLCLDCAELELKEISALSLEPSGEGSDIDLEEID